MKRAIRMNYKDGSHKDLVITKAVKMNLKDPDGENRWYLEEMNDGTYRLLFTEGIANEFADIVGIDIIREE